MLPPPPSRVHPALHWLARCCISRLCAPSYRQSSRRQFSQHSHISSRPQPSSFVRLSQSQLCGSPASPSISAIALPDAARFSLHLVFGDESGPLDRVLSKTRDIVASSTADRRSHWFSGQDRPPTTFHYFLHNLRKYFLRSRFVLAFPFVAAPVEESGCAFLLLFGCQCLVTIPCLHSTAATADFPHLNVLNHKQYSF